MMDVCRNALEESTTASVISMTEEMRELMTSLGQRSQQTSPTSTSFTSDDARYKRDLLSFGLNAVISVGLQVKNEAEFKRITRIVNTLIRNVVSLSGEKDYLELSRRFSRRK